MTGNAASPSWCAERRSVPEPRRSAGLQAGQWLLTCSIALANEPVRSSCLQAMATIKAAGDGSASTPT